VLDLLQKYYYPLGVQLIPTIGGLLTSIIVGMEDTNEEQVKKVLSSLDAACECVGVTVFYGALWMCIVRSSRTRMGAFKFLMKRWNYKVK
jgi:aspartate-semialdehyde dehydrogenase